MFNCCKFIIRKWKWSFRLLEYFSNLFLAHFCLSVWFICVSLKSSDLASIEIIWLIFCLFLFVVCMFYLFFLWISTNLHSIVIIWQFFVILLFNFIFIGYILFLDPAATGIECLARMCHPITLLLGFECFKVTWHPGETCPPNTWPLCRQNFF